MGKTSRGFTMVELLIVIVITGILAGAMLLTQWAGESKVKASVIVGELRTMQGATLFFMEKKSDAVLSSTVNYNVELAPYLDNSTTVSNPDYYAFRQQGGIWWVGIKVDQDSVRERLEPYSIGAGGRFPLYGSAAIDSPPQFLTSNLYKKSDLVVWLRAR